VKNPRISVIYQQVTGAEWCDELDPILAEKFARAVVEAVLGEVANGELDRFELELLREKFLLP
jgi:hypothetical protein